MQLLRIFDPAAEGFGARLLRLAALALAVVLVLLLAAAAVAWRSERVRYVAALASSDLGLHPVTLFVARSLERDPPLADWDAFRLEAKALRHMGHWQESLAVYDRAVAALPDSWWAHSHRCFYNALLGDARDGLDSCDRQLDLDPDQLDVAYDRRAIARALTGDNEGAVADFELAIHLMEPLGDDWRRPVREVWLTRLRAGDVPPITQEELAAERERY